MDIYLEGSVVVATTSIDLDGVQAAAYRVLDHNRTVIVASTVLELDQDATEASVTVPESANQLPGLPRALRLVEFTITGTNGERKLYTVTYVLEGVSTLTVPAQTFISYENALLLALDMPNLAGWSLADEAGRRQAMKEAHLRLNRMRYRLRAASEFQDFPGISSFDMDELFSDGLAGMTEDEFEDLPAIFLNALKFAQIAEANHILASVGSIEELRSAGVTSSRVGEAYLTFSTFGPSKTQLSDRTNEYIGRFLDKGSRIARG